MEAFSSLFRNQSAGARSAVYLSGFCAAGLLAYYMYAGTGKSSSDKLAPAVTEEEAKEILKVILDRVKLSVPRLVKYAEGIKQQVAMSGQEIDDKTLYKSVVLPHFETGVRDIQQAVLQENDVDDDEFEEAVNAYIAAGDKEIVSLAATLKKLYVNFGGEVEEDEEEETSAVATTKGKAKTATSNEISYEQLLQLLQLLSNAVLETTDDYAGKFVAKNGIPSDIAGLQQFQLGLMSLTEE